MTDGFMTAKCPATIGNVGPGFDVLGLCLETCYDYISIKLIDRKQSIVEDVTGRDAEKVPTDPRENCAVIAAEKILNIFGRTEKVALRIKRELPISGGLGSSAASSTGAAYATAALLGHNHKDEKVLQGALAGESHVAGHHLDNIAPCLLGGLTIVLSNDPPVIEHFPINREKWTFLVITPNQKLETKLARSVLPDSIKSSQWPTYAAHTAATTAHLIHGNSDGLKRGFKDYYAEPHRKDLIDAFAKTKESAMHHNAIGFSISGAGPSMLAIFDNSEQAIRCRDDILAREKEFTIIQSPANNNGTTLIEGLP